MQLLQLLYVLFSFLTLSAAVGFEPSPFEGQREVLIRRDDSSSATLDKSSSSSRKPTATSKDGKSSSSSDKKDGKSKSTSHGPEHTIYDPRLPAGGVSMLQPAITLGPQFYKIGEWVTFVWNYTSLSSTPKHIDVLATCTDKNAMYTIAVNQSVNKLQSILWDTGAYQASATLPLLTETYTLIVYDALSSISAAPSAGYLAVFDTFQFYMYSPLPYVPLADYNCATCNAAVSSLERQALGFLLGTCGITILTFTWFANTFGLF